jgi:hypothetical protein
MRFWCYDFDTKARMTKAGLLTNVNEKEQQQLLDAYVTAVITICLKPMHGGL